MNTDALPLRQHTQVRTDDLRAIARAWRDPEYMRELVEAWRKEEKTDALQMLENKPQNLDIEAVALAAWKDASVPHPFTCA